MKRFEKAMANRFLGGTKLGRSKILKRFGDTASNLVDGLKDAASKFSGKSTGRRLKKTLLKLAVKTAIAWRQNKINKEAFVELQLPVIEIGRTLLELFRRRAGSVDPAKATNQMMALLDRLMPIFKEYMKPKNVKKAHETVEYVSSKEFLMFLINDPSYSPEKTAILKSLSSLMEELDPLGEVQLCNVKGCLVPRTRLEGAEYCPAHHALAFPSKPSFTVFLRNATYLHTFKTFLSKYNPAYLILIDFYSKVTPLVPTLRPALTAAQVENFRSIASKQLVKARAPTVIQRYMYDEDVCGPGVTAGPAKPVSLEGVSVECSSAEGRYIIRFPPGTAERLKQAEATPKSRMFNEAQVSVFKTLLALYHGPFLDSEEYKAFAATNIGLPVPPQLLDGLEPLAPETSDALETACLQSLGKPSALPKADSDSGESKGSEAASGLKVLGIVGSVEDIEAAEVLKLKQSTYTGNDHRKPVIVEVNGGTSREPVVPSVPDAVDIDLDSSSEDGSEGSSEEETKSN